MLLSQTTATDFTVNDCGGNSHNLFSELDAGKIIVIAWVMPCGSCAAPSLAAYNAVQSYSSSNPDQVYFYLVDDFANTSCATLTSWGNTNSMFSATKFSNAAISMNDYGTAGMPKIVVLGGTDHAIAYNQNSGVTTSNVQQAINSLLSAGINEVPLKSTFELSVVPNPVFDKFNVNYTLKNPSKVTLELFTSEGKFVMSKIIQIQQSGNYSEKFEDVGELQNGVYILKLQTDEFTESIKFIVEK